ncbi:MAG: hypothetical protein V4858_15600 [Pseudomonadota bacterium]
MYPTTVLTPEQRADLHTQARRQAQLLRRAAIAGFWRGVYRLGASALQATWHVVHRTTTTTATTLVSRNPSGV